MASGRSSGAITQLQATRLDAEGGDRCCFGIEQSIFAAPHTPRIRLLSRPSPTSNSVVSNLLPNFALGRRHRRCCRTGLRLRPRALLDEVRRCIQRAEWFDSHSGKPFDEFAEYIGFTQRPGRCEAAPEGPAGPLQDALPVDVVPPPIGTVELVAVAFDGKPLVAAAFDHHVDAIRSRLDLRHHSI